MTTPTLVHSGMARVVAKAFSQAIFRAEKESLSHAADGEKEAAGTAS